MPRIAWSVCFCGLVGLLTVSCSSAEPVNLGQASQEESAEAVAHYARSRALLISAIHEFDQARKIARADELLDSTKWRNTLIDRAEDLERVLDPQPKATKGGIRFSPDPRLLPEARK